MLLVGAEVVGDGVVGADVGASHELQPLQSQPTSIARAHE